VLYVCVCVFRYVLRAMCGPACAHTPNPAGLECRRADRLAAHPRVGSLSKLNSRLAAPSLLCLFMCACLCVRCVVCRVYSGQRGRPTRAPCGTQAGHARRRSTPQARRRHGGIRSRPPLIVAASVFVLCRECAVCVCVCSRVPCVCVVFGLLVCDVY